jgi:hypothetical protein
VLKRNDGRHFDQHLVRRFVQLIGIYPVGTIVRLDTGEVGVVQRSYAPDPYRPHVRVLIGREGARLELPYDINCGRRPTTRSCPRRSLRRSIPPITPFDPLTVDMRRTALVLYARAAGAWRRARPPSIHRSSR